jgi:hypothetical protein
VRCEKNAAKEFVDVTTLTVTVTICIVFFGWAGCCLKCLGNMESGSYGSTNKDEFDSNYDKAMKITVKKD